MAARGVKEELLFHPRLGGVGAWVDGRVSRVIGGLLTDRGGE